MKILSIKNIIAFAAIVTVTISACRKDDYFVDGGLSHQSPEDMKMSVYDFLKSRENHMFDSLVKVIDLTGTKDLVNQPNITFFAAPNQAVLRLQQNFVPDDRQTPRPLSDIGLDTLKNLLGRFIITDVQLTLEQAVLDKKKYYKAYNGDSLYIHGSDGGVKPGTTLQTSAYYITYEHRKIPGVDSVNYNGTFQTHNLVTANAIVHVLKYKSSFAAGLKQKYYR
ncbi:hypothetical protein COR50_20060 [Chitinophaga caeni]|uniref:FAS1 domain-containing protein n=1 Tax=Chitinophaga caeni TaxID=2029983 RepID=A0A291QZH1_9BACT|nr:hypothetical protein [Chitinophaga caeni]ATL49282.1 hypothetical protein COR50_20060 [Chitinophaga caeni]